MPEGTLTLPGETQSTARHTADRLLHKVPDGHHRVKSGLDPGTARCCPRQP
ncbi:hypothetical protein ACFY8O_34020 [Streptomyces argenteolus]|uniref:Uncharacterized protein n=1 Tax=Streptomyces argenteolus TaxID=67274 RepID=A0ABW6XGN6_9ACTN